MDIEVVMFIKWNNICRYRSPWYIINKDGDFGDNTMFIYRWEDIEYKTKCYVDGMISKWYTIYEWPCLQPYLIPWYNC